MLYLYLRTWKQWTLNKHLLKWWMANYTLQGPSMIFICIGCYRKYRNIDNSILPRSVYFIRHIFNSVEKFWNKKVIKIQWISQLKFSIVNQTAGQWKTIFKVKIKDLYGSLKLKLSIHIINTYLFSTYCAPGTAFNGAVKQWSRHVHFCWKSSVIIHLKL